MDDLSTGAESRRSLIKAAALVTGAAIVPWLAAARAAIAAKLSRADVRDQDKPNAGTDCDGYCLAFTPKPKQG